MDGCSADRVASFQDDTEGNEQAEALFVKWGKKLGLKNKDVDAALDTGTFEQPCTNKFVIICHSTEWLI